MIIYSSVLDVVVIGAGHAGISISYLLKQHHLNHIVFERRKIGDSWCSQRWDTFKLNTSNKVNVLPGIENTFPDPDGFCSAPEFARFLIEYVKKFDLPVREQCKVIMVEKIPDSKLFWVSVSENDVINKYMTKRVVVASGAQNEKKIPYFSKNISQNILQIHACEFRNESSLPNGAVLVVGSGQSGTQITEDLIDSGRKIFISTSQVGRIPRRYRGIDIFDWLISTGFLDLRTEEIIEQQLISTRQPQVSGVGLRGRTLSLQSLSKRGAVILGKIDNLENEIVFLQPNAGAHVKFADESSKKMKNMIDDYINKSQLSLPSPELDAADSPDDKVACASNLTSLHLRDNDINSIIWTTGFSGDFGYLKLPVLNSNGTLKHRNGVSEIEGLFFIGLPWLRKRKSGIIWGIKEDAEYLIEKISGQ